jgi:uncharacterized protein (TIGR03382 family)
MFPANYDEPTIVVVAGSLRDDSLNPYSHYGAWSVDLAAPGVDLCSLGAQGLDNYYTAGGTSYATPLVAAAAALVMEAHPDLTAIDVARVLRASALKVPELEGKVRSGGRLDVHQALNTPVPRLEEPPAVALDGRGSLPLSFRNPGGEGPGLLLLFHGPGFEVTDAEGWSTTAFSVGDVLDLPDAGSWSADAPGTLIEGTLAQHQVDTLQLSLSGRELGEQEFSVRLVATSADYLNAPYDEGSDDPTGFLAWSGRVTVTALDTGHDSADDSGVLDTPEKPSPQSCGCSAGSHASWSGLLALGLLWLGRRLRRKAPDKALS